jgi:ABC-type dipeptide/oligopeptide/nickel transport system permease component
MTSAAPEVATPRQGRAPRTGNRPGRLALSAARRIGWILVVVWAAVSLTFILGRLVPADPARLAAGLNAGPDQVAEVRRQLGLDLPIWQQYVKYLGGIVRFDFGDSIQSRQPVLKDILYFLPPTLELVLTAFVVYALVGVALGVIWAALPRGLHARIISLLSILGAALPVFWIGLLLQLVIASGWNLLPVSGDLDYRAYNLDRVTGFSVIDAIIGGNTYALGDAITHLILPVATLVVSALGLAVRLTRSSVAEQLRMPYIRTARARGNSPTSVVLRDALRNAMAPVVTMLGLQFGWMLGGTIIVEVVFSWPGLGLYAFNAFRTFDYNPILGITLVVTATFVIVNEITDAIIRKLDPRVGELS